MFNENSNHIYIDRSKSFLHRHYLLLKSHYFLCHSSLASFGPILDMTLYRRGFSNLEISYINLVVPFLVFFINPLIGYLADHTRRFRFIFNITFGLATILFIIMFVLPSLKTYHIQGQLYQTKTMKYSMVFCANKDFANKCALRSECGCVYQAICTPVRTRAYFNESLSMKKIHLNFTMNSENLQKNFKNPSISSKKHSTCDINYRVSINKIIHQYTEYTTRGK